MFSSMFYFTGGKMKQKELYKTAIYCRLSLDDGSEGDSSSIHTQKMLLEKYCKDNGYETYDYYIDDGLTELKNQKEKINHRLNVLSNLVSKVFEDYASNLMSFENYQFLLNKYQDEQKSLNLKLREIDNKLTENLDQPLEKVKKFMEVAKNF